MKLQQKPIAVRCPQCGRAMKTPFSPVVTDREAVLSDSFFSAMCKCGYRAAVTAPCLYYDAHRSALLYLLPGTDAQPLHVDAYPEVAGFRKRIVGTVPQLREKIRLLEFGLDDRAVELAKLAVVGWVSARRSARVHAAYFAELDEASHRIGFYLSAADDAPALYRARTDVYDAACEIAASLPEPDGFCRIDLRWAAHTLANRPQSKRSEET